MVKKLSGAFIVLMVILAIIAGALFYLRAKQPPAIAPKLPAKESPSAVLPARFAFYEEIPVEIIPSVEPYIVESNLSNVTNKDYFEFSSSVKDRLEKNAFVVVPSNFEEFFSLYENNRYEGLPSFITTDSVLHHYHLMFDFLLRSLETEKFYPELKNLSEGVLQSSEEQYSALRGTNWEGAARRNVAFFAVANKLLDTDFEVPDIVKTEVNKELKLIEKHEGFESSPVINIGGGDYKEDYSQYVPRGHYDQTDLLKTYFKTMMWYGRLTFLSKNKEATRSALLMTLALKEPNNLKSWETIYEPTNFFVGKSDDLTYYQYEKLMKKTYGSDVNLTALQGEAKFNAFFEGLKDLPVPAINSLSPEEEKEKGFRFMGQRYVIDADIFDKLIFDRVGGNDEGESRMLPKGLDIPAAMGSKEAYEILDSMGETKYLGYPENLNELKSYISSLKIDIWAQNLYWGWLYTLHPLLNEELTGYPSFMCNRAWICKSLNTYLGSWTELKHDTILYAKQAYAEGDGPEEKKEDDRGYVEPNPHLYGRLASLLGMTKEGLKSRGLLTSKNEENLSKMEKLVLSLKTISEKELTNEPLTKDEYDLIKFYGEDLEHFWIEALRDEGVESPKQLFEHPAPLVADVATGDGQVLEEATGYIYEIYVVVPVDGELRITRGGVYSYYEFPWPMDDRLTNKKWREMLYAGEGPELPSWTDSFLTK